MKDHPSKPTALALPQITANENNVLFQKMISNVADVVVIIDQEGINRYTSPNVEKQFGWKPEEIINQSILESLHPKDLNKVRRNIISLLRKPKSSKTLEIRYRCKNGDYRWVKFTGINLLHDPDVNGILGNYHDITEQKKYEKALVTNSANMEAIIENTEDSIWAINKNYEITYVNSVFQQAFLASFGVNLEPGMILPEALPEYIRPIWMERYKKALNNERFNIIDSIDTEAGTIYIEVSFNPILVGKKVVGASFFGRDITERKLTEAELIKAKEKAEKSDHLKSAFLANMSHEIRTPMNAIVGFSELLSNEELPKEKKELYLEYVNSSSKRLLNIITDIVDVSKIDANLLSIRTETCDVNKVLDNLLAQFSISIKEPGVDLLLSKELSDQESITKTDQYRLMQIISNLLENAIKFTKKGSIEFGYTLENNRLRFFVKDSGIGIAPENHQLIFDRFGQTEQEYTKSNSGTGLGLSIAKSLTELLGGDMWVESEINQGACFNFTIPYMACNKKPETNNNTTPIAKGELKKVLVAEDDQLNFMYLRELLSKYDFELLHAKNGIEAVELVNQNPDIDFVLMDMKMPEMNGFEATKTIRKHNQELPIIAQTAYSMADDQTKVFEAGCNDYICKPITKNRLAELINKYIHKS